MVRPYTGFNTRKTPQSEPIPGSGQVANSAGGFSFELDDWKRLDRFLILGSEGGTYYIKERELTIQSADVVVRCLKADPQRTVDKIREISQAGRAARNDPAIFALALAISSDNTETRKMAFRVVNDVCRTGTHIMNFATYAANLRGWGRVLKDAVAHWYNNKRPEQVAYQAIKYRSRGNWTHKGLLRMSHPRHINDNGPVYDWIMGGEGRPGRKEQIFTLSSLPPIVEGFLKVQEIGATDINTTARLIQEYRLPREALPTEVLKDPQIWRALLEVDMPPEAMIRNLGNMGSVGLLKPMSEATDSVVARIQDTETMRRARVHPIKILAAMKTYAQGHGFRGDNSWEPVGKIVDALDAAFYASFGNVEPTDKRTMLALDVSGSMGSPIMNMPFLTCREASSAMALVTANVEPNYMFTAFQTVLKPLSISPRQRLDDIMKIKWEGGGTDCAQPMIYALEKNLLIDVFVIYTDSETWGGRVHPPQALAEYRRKTGINAKLVVVGMTSNGFSIADPRDPGMLDVVGFDTNTPSAIAEFVRD